MFQRSIKLLKSNSFFLFGARGTGKSTLLRSCEWLKGHDTLWIDLLDPSLTDRFLETPSLLTEMIQKHDHLRWVVIDEVQKAPKLLDLVHWHIEDSKRRGSPILFALTGSSARKLKRGHANLLAGRAFLNYLFPLTHEELGHRFDLKEALGWGTLPNVFEFDSPNDRAEYLKSYCAIFVSEEVVAEQLVRQLPSFKRFLRVAAQSNGKILNYSKIARDIGTDYKTAQSYFQILEDTLLGFFLNAYHASFRKRFAHKPKFYFFDLGITRTLSDTLGTELTSGTHAYGEAFEHFIISEILRIASYRKTDFSLSYLRTKDDAEIDLIIERPGKRPVFLEIKSGSMIHSEDIRTLECIASEFECEPICLSLDPIERKIGKVRCLPWQVGIRRIFNE